MHRDLLRKEVGCRGPREDSCTLAGHQTVRWPVSALSGPLITAQKAAPKRKSRGRIDRTPAWYCLAYAVFLELGGFVRCSLSMKCKPPSMLID